MSSSSSSTEHSTETIRKTGGKDKNYAKSLIKRYAEIVEYYLENKVEKGFDKVFKQTRVTSGGVKWEIHPTKWNKMMETDNDSKNVLFQYISDKRASYWDEKKSGMSHFGLVSTSIKTQMKKQQIHYTNQYAWPEGNDSRPSSGKSICKYIFSLHENIKNPEQSPGIFKPQPLPT